MTFVETIEFSGATVSRQKAYLWALSIVFIAVILITASTKFTPTPINAKRAPAFNWATVKGFVVSLTARHRRGAMPKVSAFVCHQPGPITVMKSSQFRARFLRWILVFVFLGSVGRPLPSVSTPPTARSNACPAA